MHYYTIILKKQQQKKKQLKSLLYICETGMEILKHYKMDHLVAKLSKNRWTIYFQLICLDIIAQGAPLKSNTKCFAQKVAL